DKEASVRVRAAEALWKIDRQTTTTVPVLVEVLKDEKVSLEIRENAAEVAGQIGPPAQEAAPLLIPLLQFTGRCRVVRQAQIGPALLAMGPDVVPHLIQALGDNNFAIQRGAAGVLVQFGPTAVPGLAKAVGACKETGRAAVAAGTLGQIGPKAREAVP